MREELRQWVRDALDRMSPRDREVLVLRYLEMLSNKEIAEVLGITEGAVKVRHLRALERLRSRLDDNNAEGSAMNQHTNGSATSAGADPDLAQLIDELADRYQSGEPVDWDAVAREHPDRVDRVRALWPAIAAMAELGSVTGRHSRQAISVKARQPP